MAMACCWLLVFVWVWWLPFMFAGGKEQQGEGCSAERCGNLTISDPFWLTDLETGRSCGSLDFEVNCNNSIPVLRSSGSTGLSGFAIKDILHEERSLHVVDLHKEEDFNVSNGCHFPRWNTSRKLGHPFKVNPINLNLIFYNCTKTVALVEVRCVNTSNAFVCAGVRYYMTGGYAGYALEGCDAIVVPVLGSLGEVNASNYKRLISDGFVLTWDPPPARKFFNRQSSFYEVRR
ncbi:uncharacterized protein [Triticum aestivum]|nr:uncharacterized protein LOC123068439 [Triticum aestivum]